VLTRQEERRGKGTGIYPQTHMSLGGGISLIPKGEKRGWLKKKGGGGGGEKGDPLITDSPLHRSLGGETWAAQEGKKKNTNTKPLRDRSLLLRQSPGQRKAPYAVGILQKGERGKRGGDDLLQKREEELNKKTGGLKKRKGRSSTSIRANRSGRL